MKTTIDITDGLLAEAKRVAARRHTTVRALVEDGLRLVLEREEKREPFKLRDGSVGGGGLRPEMRDASHEEWLDAVYGDRT
jgi:Arc/MetJ family transcription regulator